MPDLDPAVLKAAALAMVPFGDGELDLFEWHHCEDTPACHGPAQPCACAGMPWPSEPVRAALAAAAPLIREAVANEAADLLRSHAQEFEIPSPLYGLLMSASRSVRALGRPPEATDG